MSAFLPLTVANLHLSGTTCTCIPYHNLKAKIIRTVWQSLIMKSDHPGEVGPKNNISKL